MYIIKFQTFKRAKRFRAHLLPKVLRQPEMSELNQITRKNAIFNIINEIQYWFSFTNEILVYKYLVYTPITKPKLVVET